MGKISDLTVVKIGLAVVVVVVVVGGAGAGNDVVVAIGADVSDVEDGLSSLYVMSNMARSG